MTIELRCWAFTRGLDICGGAVTWTRSEVGEWSSKCAKCGATGSAAVGERRELEVIALERRVGA